MKKKFTLLLLVIVCTFSSIAQPIPPAEDKIKVYVHEPIELLFTIYHLTPAGINFFKPNRKEQDWMDIMSKPLTAPFRSFHAHPAVLAMQKLHSQYREWFPLLVSIGIQNEQMPLLPNLYKPEANTSHAKAVRNFIQLANQFYYDSQFGEKYKERKAIYTAIEEEVKHHLPQKGFIEAMETFYQQSFLSYNLCPSPLLPAGNGMGFGPYRETPEGIEVFNVFSGLDRPDIHPTTILKEKATFGFNNEGWIRGICTHEFGHSFVNGPLSKYRKQFTPFKKRLKKPIRKKMRRQGYGNWETTLAEHLVRVGEIRIADRLGLEEVSKDLFYDYYVGRKFIYLPHFLTIFRQYEEQTTYASFIDFLPQIVASLSQINVKEEKRAWKAAKRLNKSQVVPPSIEATHPVRLILNDKF